MQKNETHTEWKIAFQSLTKYAILSKEIFISRVKREKTFSSVLKSITTRGKFDGSRCDTHALSKIYFLSEKRLD